MYLLLREPRGFVGRHFQTKGNHFTDGQDARVKMGLGLRHGRPDARECHSVRRLDFDLPAGAPESVPAASPQGVCPVRRGSR